MAYSEKPLILVIEDSRVLGKIIDQKLIPFFRIEIVSDAEEAQQILAGENEYAAILLDLVLPKIDGLELLRQYRALGKNTPVIIITSKARDQVESTAKELGVDVVLSKPLDFDLLVDSIRQEISKSSLVFEESSENKFTGKKNPFRIAKKCCFICGYDKVNVFLPIAEGIYEDWHKGAYPVYTTKNGYSEWDGIKTLISVCPYCLFASSDPMDFANNSEANYPYSEESKKILARTISFRQRLIPEALNIDPRFDTPNRDQDTVVNSLILAEKCSNGLILGGKLGGYVQAGLYSTLIGAFDPSQEKFREALGSFENQLKHKDTARRLLVKTYFFCIVLNMQLNRTIVGRDIMKKVEELYAESAYEEISDDEREWLMCINHIWKAGIALNRRDLM